MKLVVVRPREVFAAPSAADCFVTPVTLDGFTSLSIHRRYMVEQRKKTGTLNLRIDPKLKAAAERAAADDQRSLTSLVEKLLTEHLKAKGYLRHPGSDEGLRPAELTSDNNG
jgi:hypothetical protein